MKFLELPSSDLSNHRMLINPEHIVSLTPVITGTRVAMSNGENYFTTWEVGSVERYILQGDA